MRRLLLKNARGVTLVELIIVIFILSIGTIVGLIEYNAYIANSRLKNAVDDIVANVNQAKQSSMAQSRLYKIDFSLTGYTMSSCNDIGSVCTSGTWTQVSSVTFSGYGSGVAGTAIEGGNTLTFQPRGMVDAKKTISLKNNRPSTASVQVSPTGRPSVSVTPK
jgi:prepilin-type N-terminal cleavage/methylation domain-containing protein